MHINTIMNENFKFCKRQLDFYVEDQQSTKMFWKSNEEDKDLDAYAFSIVIHLSEDTSSNKILVISCSLYNRKSNLITKILVISCSLCNRKFEIDEEFDEMFKKHY